MCCYVHVSCEIDSFIWTHFLPGAITWPLVPGITSFTLYLSITASDPLPTRIICILKCNSTYTSKRSGINVSTYPAQIFKTQPYFSLKLVMMKYCTCISMSLNCIYTCISFHPQYTILQHNHCIKFPIANPFEWTPNSILHSAVAHCCRYTFANKNSMVHQLNIIKHISGNLLFHHAFKIGKSFTKLNNYRKVNKKFPRQTEQFTAKCYKKIRV